VDIVVASAGLGGGPFITSASAPSVDEDPPVPSTAAIDVNLTGVFYTASLALYYFRVPPKTSSTNGPTTNGSHADGEKADKSLVFISSLAGYIDLPWASAYNAAKFGVRGLWRSLRGGVSGLSPQHNIRVNLIAPWFVKTPMTSAIASKIDELGYEWATVEGVVDGVVRCAADAGIKGRAIAILPGGNVDLGDDTEGGEGGEALKKVMEFARGKGDGEGEKFEMGGREGV
jgi:5'-hydroxyaverantin dehydrogenase